MTNADRQTKPSLLFSFSLILVLLLVVEPASAQGRSSGDIRRENIKQVSKPGRVKPGKIGLVKEKNGSYLLWVPPSYRKGRSFNLVVFLHGVGSNGWSYYLLFRDRRILFPKAILLLPYGPTKQREHTGSIDIGTFDDIYRWPRSGKKLNKAAKRVAGSTKNVKKAFGVDRTFIGGHSNGGLPASRTAMNHPELYDGVFIWEGGVPRVTEPNNRQKRIPIALIWGSRGSTKPEKLKIARKQLERRETMLHNRALVAHGFFLKGNHHGGFKHNGQPFYRGAYNWLSSVTDAPGKVLESARSWKSNGQKKKARDALKLLLRRKNLSDGIKKKAENILKKLDSDK